MNSPCQPRFDLPDRACQVATTHTELDGNVAAAGLAVNLKCAIVQDDSSHLAQRNIISVRRGKEDFADGLWGSSKFRKVADYKVEAAIALKNLGGRQAANGGLNGGIDVCGHQAVPGAGTPVDRNEKFGLAGDGINAEVSNTLHLSHGVANLTCFFNQYVDIFSEKFERIFTFNARHRFFDIVLNVL